MDGRDFLPKIQYEDDEPDEIIQEETKVSPSKAGSFVKSQLLVLIQTGLCILVLAFGLTLKAIGGSLYAQIATWYFDSYNNSVFTGTASPPDIIKDETVITETSRASPDEFGKSEESKKSLPLKSGTITSGYGERDYNGETQFHKGADIAAEKGSKIFAVFDGKVKTAENDPSYGNYIVLEHNDGLCTLYAHCDKLLVEKGGSVKAGDSIAEVGETGDADGSHLHFEVLKNGENIDPLTVIGDAYK